MSGAAAVTRWRLTAKGEGAVVMRDGAGVPSAEAFAQLTALVRAQGRTLAQLEARVARLDAHGGELAGEVLDVIARLDGLDARIRGFDARLAAHHRVAHAGIADGPAPR